RRVLVFRIAHKARFGGLEYRQIMETGDHHITVAVTDKQGRTNFGRCTVEGMIMVINARPAIFFCGPTTAGDPVKARGEVIGSPAQELPGGLDALLRGSGNNCVFLGLRVDHGLVIAFSLFSDKVSAPLP